MEGSGTSPGAPVQEEGQGTAVGDGGVNNPQPQKPKANTPQEVALEAAIQAADKASAEWSKDTTNEEKKKTAKETATKLAALRKGLERASPY